MKRRRKPRTVGLPCGERRIKFISPFFFFGDLLIVQTSKRIRPVPKNITERTDAEIVEKIFGKRVATPSPLQRDGSS